MRILNYVCILFAGLFFLAFVTGVYIGIFTQAGKIASAGVFSLVPTAAFTILAVRFDVLAVKAGRRR